MIKDEMKKNFLHHHRTINAVLPPKKSCKGVLTRPFDRLYYNLNGSSQYTHIKMIIYK